VKTPLPEEFPDDRPVTWDDIALLWEELKGAARAVLAQEWNAGTVHTTQLLNSALKKLVPASRDWREVSWANRRHFFADLHQAMRRRLIDYADARNRHKRRILQMEGNLGSEFINPLAESGALNLDRLVETAGANAELAEAVDRALAELDRLYPGQRFAEIVQVHSFERLTDAEIGAMIEEKPDTVRKRRRRAYGILRDELKAFFTGDQEEEQP